MPYNSRHHLHPAHTLGFAEYECLLKAGASLMNVEGASLTSFVMWATDSVWSEKCSLKGLKV